MFTAGKTKINPIFAKTPWGYSVPYYLAAINNCHPDYAKYLADKQTVPVEVINELLGSIPDNNKAIYNEALIERIYLEKIENLDTRNDFYFSKTLIVQ